MNKKKLFSILMLCFIVLLGCSKKIENSDSDIDPPDDIVSDDEIIDDPEDEIPEIPNVPEFDNELEDMLKSVVFEFEDSSSETILEGDYFKNKYPKEDFDGNLFYKDYGFIQNGTTSKNFDSMIIGTHQAFFTLTFKGNDDIEKQEVMRISRDIIINSRDFSDFNNPETININDSRILNKIFVDNSEGLSDEIKSLTPGDAIILKDGNYDSLNTKIEVNGTPKNPIFILAENPGKVIFIDEVNINTKGAFIVISGLKFIGTPMYDSGVFKIEGNYNRISNIKMYKLTYNIDDSTGFSSKHSWLQISGKYNEVDNSTFEGKDSHGVLLVVSRVDGKEDHHNIHHNHFLDFSNPTELTNEFEVIRVGTSSESRSMSYTKIKFNLFERINAEAENISIKAGGNEISGNVILESKSSITLRHGVENIVENNIIIGNGILGTSGIRVFDRGHIIKNNFISNIDPSNSNYKGAIVLHSGNNSDGGTTSDNGQWTVVDLLIEGNTIHNSTKGIVFENDYDRKYGPIRVTLKDNLIYSERNTDIAVVYETSNEEKLNTFIYEGNEVYVDIVYDIKNIFEGTDTLISNNRPVLVQIDNIYYLSNVGVENLKYLTSLDVGSFN